MTKPTSFTFRGPKGGLIVRRAATLKKLPALVRRFKKVSVTLAPVDVRAAVVGNARWGGAHEPQIHYTETAGRDDWLNRTPRALPMSTDCSGFVTACYKWAGAPDPNGLGYHQLGYTGTLLSHSSKHGKIILNPSKARPGDLIVIGPGTGDHVVVVIEQGADPLVVSHGKEAGPVVQRLSVDNRAPRRVCVTLP